MNALPKTLRLLLTLGLIITLASTSGSKANAQVDPVSGLTVGIVLNKMMDQLQQAIEAARNAGLSVEIEAGQQTAVAIQNAQNAYAQSLNATFDQHLNPTIKSTIDQLQSVVNDVSSNTFGNLDTLTARTQQIVNSLPFRSHEPQLTSFSPKFMVPTQQVYPVTLKFQGNFEAAAQKGFNPKFMVGEHSYTPSGVTTQELDFVVPVADLLAAGPATDLNKYSYSTGTLTVPWQTTSLLGILKHNHQDQYKLLLGILPSSPGKIQVVYTTVSMVPHTIMHTGSVHYQTSAQDGQNNDHPDVPYSEGPDIDADHPWHIVPGTSKFNAIPFTTGVWSNSLVSDQGDQAVYRVTTIHKGMFGISGQVHFTISFQETQMLPVTNTSTETVNLSWGDSQHFPYAAGTWTVIYDGFDGSHQEWHSAQNQNPFLTTSDEAGDLVIQAANPATLSWP